MDLKYIFLWALPTFCISRSECHSTLKCFFGLCLRFCCRDILWPCRFSNLPGKYTCLRNVKDGVVNIGESSKSKLDFQCIGVWTFSFSHAKVDGLACEGFRRVFIFQFEVSECHGSFWGIHCYMLAWGEIILQLLHIWCERGIIGMWI